jgi:hypothetical protein
MYKLTTTMASSIDTTQYSSGHLFCICNSLNDPSQPMVKCESCKDWFHFKCVGFASSDIKTSFHCPKCRKRKDNFFAEIIKSSEDNNTDSSDEFNDSKKSDNHSLHSSDIFVKDTDENSSHNKDDCDKVSESSVTIHVRSQTVMMIEMGRKKSVLLESLLILITTRTSLIKMLVMNLKAFQTEVVIGKVMMTSVRGEDILQMAAMHLIQTKTTICCIVVINVKPIAAMILSFHLIWTVVPLQRYDLIIKP